MHTSMNIKYKKPPINKKKVFLITLGVLIFLLAIGGAFYTIGHLKAGSDKQITQSSSFSFNDSATPNWWAADNFYNTSPSETDSNNTTTVVGRNIAQGTPEHPGKCFVMYAFKEGTINIDQALIERKKSVISNNDKLSVEDYAPQSIAMATSEGSKTYVLYQYSIIGSPGTNISRGLALGYVPLKSGYVEVQGICEEANQLPDALKVYPAVSFEKL